MKMANTSKNIAFLVFFIIIMAALTCAAEASSELQINSVEVSIDGDTKLKTSGNNGELEVAPGDQLTVKVTLENTYDYDTGDTIEDLEVEARIYDIDDGGDVSDSENVDLRADREKTVTLKLDIPDDASDSETYDFEITADGTDQEGNSQSDSLMIEVSVGGEAADITIDEFDMSDAECGSAYLRITLNNAGEEEVKDARLRVISEGDQLYTETFDVPGAGDPDEDGTYSISARIDTDGLDEGSHIFEAVVEYGAGQSEESEETSGYVQQCDNGYDGTNDYDYAAEETDGGPTSAERWEIQYQQLKTERGKLELVMQEDTYVEPQTQEQEIVVPPRAEKSDGLTVAALVLGNIAVIVFIGLIVYSRYQY
jgi:hypothetical protein